MHAKLREEKTNSSWLPEGWCSRYLVGWSYSSYNSAAANILDLAGYRQILRPVSDPDADYYDRDTNWIPEDMTRTARYPTLSKLWPDANYETKWDSATCAAIAAELRALIAAQPEPEPSSDSEFDGSTEETTEQRFRRVGQRIASLAPCLAIMCDEAAARGGILDSG